MGKMATLILAGAEDDVIIMVLIHTASQKNWFLLSTPCQRHKKEGELTGLIYGPLVNDDTPSTPFHTVPVHDTSISINSHHPSEGSHSPLGSPTWLQVQCNSKIDYFSALRQLFSPCTVGCCCATFNLILFLILISPKHWPGTPIVVELRKKECSGYSLALCHSISVNTTQYHFFSSPSLPCGSLSANKVAVFVFMPILGTALFSITYIFLTSLPVTHLLSTRVLRVLQKMLLLILTYLIQCVLVKR